MSDTPPFVLPRPVEATVRHFLTCEFSTFSKSGSPITWPVSPFYLARQGQFLVFSSIGLPQKAINVRRNSRVSLFYSDPTGSGLDSPAQVHIGGDAESPDEIFASPRGQDEEIVSELKAQIKQVMRLQPGTAIYLSNPLARWLMDWYFMRLAIFISPRWIRWWFPGEKDGQSHFMEVARVEEN
jgi:hypothetical protein